MIATTNTMLATVSSLSESARPRSAKASCDRPSRPMQINVNARAAVRNARNMPFTFHTVQSWHVAGDGTAPCRLSFDFRIKGRCPQADDGRRCMRDTTINRRRRLDCRLEWSSPPATRRAPILRASPVQRLRRALRRQAKGDRPTAKVLALVPEAGLDAVLVAIELALEAAPPFGRVTNPRIPV